MPGGRADGPIERVVIVGGGTAGWMVAAALARVARQQAQGGRPLAITLVESDAIGTIGVGEATIPPLGQYLQAMGLPEDRFVAETGATFKLGIEFVGWGDADARYLHGFGTLGQPWGALDFMPYWQRMRAEGRAADLDAYALARAACRAGRFLRAQPQLGDSPMAEIAHAYHFDAGRFAALLRRLAEPMGVVRLEGRIERVVHHAVDREGGARTGDVAALVLDDGRTVAGDLFIDCSGFRALLIGTMAGAEWEDWSHWLPCDRAVAMPCAHPSPERLPYTRATAQRAGWQWRIPLQERIGNGLVYASADCSGDEAVAVLRAGLDGPALGEPRLLRLATGTRRAHWRGNVIAVGLAAGFLEPLESTSIHLIQVAVARLVEWFPDRGFAQPDVDAFNAAMTFEMIRIRDFIILHYHLNRRPEPFWQRCRAMPIPESLARRIALYRSHGRIVREANELFAEFSWLQVFEGQGLRPERVHPVAAMADVEALDAWLRGLADLIGRCVQAMPPHEAFVAGLMEHVARQPKGVASAEPLPVGSGLPFFAPAPSSRRVPSR